MNSLYWSHATGFQNSHSYLSKGGGGTMHYCSITIVQLQFKKQLILNDDHAVIVNSGSK